MNFRSLLACASLILGWSWQSVASERPAWMDQGPQVDEELLAIELPLQVLGTKLFVEVEVAGVARRFVFDTGSPSMLNASLARELDLQAVDRRSSRDAHGAVVETEIMQVDLGLGSTQVRKVPVFVAEFPATAACLFDGVLGSELLPLCAWQIDLPDMRLRCHADRDRLEHVNTKDRQPLHTFGYPHAPFLDVHFADQARSKALFDTGSADYFAISQPDLDGARRNDAIGSTLTGQGSMGGSMGGLAAQREQQLVVMKSLGIGSLTLGPAVAMLRDQPPSLIGASLLEQYVVTLDTRDSAAYFDRYREAPFSRATFGFGLSFEDGVKVSLLWKDSPATRAGLAIGTQLKAIDGKATSTSCDDIRDAMQAVSSNQSIHLEWEGGEATLERQAMLLR